MTDAAAEDLEIDHPSEIAALFEEAVDSQLRLHLQAPDGPELALAVQRVDRAANALELRLPGLVAQAPPWLLAGPVHAFAVLDKVRIDFELARPANARDSTIAAARPCCASRCLRACAVTSAGRPFASRRCRSTTRARWCRSQASRGPCA
jgi:hypothetical protein